MIVFHAGLPLPGGFTGVDVFFVISGFVISGLILRHQSGGGFRYATFYAKRAQRLLPALFLMIIVVFIASLLFQSPFGAQETTAATGIGAALISANVVITRELGGYFSTEAAANPLLHTWSLSVEEQFYAVFPLLLMLGLAWGARAGRTSSIRNAVLVVSALSLVSFIFGVALTFGWIPFGLTTQPETWAFYLSPARAWEFGVGALLALGLWGRHSHMTPRLASVVGSLGAILLVTSFFVISEGTPFPGIAALVPVMGTAALIAAGSVRNPVSQSISIRPLVRIGDWSYSLYLWHWPFIVFAVLLWPGAWAPIVAAMLSFIPAIASFHLVEDPIRRRRILHARILIWSVALSGAVILAGLGLWRAGPSLVPGIASLNEQRQVPTISQTNGCFIPNRFQEGSADVYLRECWFPAPDPVGWVLLAGDSHASHISNAVIRVANDAGLSVFTLTGGACPFVRGQLAYSDVDNCEAMNDFLWNMVESTDPPAAVVLGSKGVPEGATDTLRTLTEMGIPTAWLRTVPRWAPLEQGLQTLPCTGGMVNFSCDSPRSVVETNAADTRLEEQSLLAAFPDTVPIDVQEVFCNGSRCSPISQGLLRYLDNEHLNGYGSELLMPQMRSAFRSLGIGREAFAGSPED